MYMLLCLFPDVNIEYLEGIECKIINMFSKTP